MPSNRQLLRPLAALAGFVCVALGVIGAIVPLMPSTVFFIAAAACFAHASPRLEAWLLSFEFIGGPVRAWRERGAIALPAKLMASAGMTTGLIVYALTDPGTPALAAAAVLIGLSALFVWTRPG